MSISSHTGIVILIIIGIATVLGVIIIGIIEAKKSDKERMSAAPPKSETPPSKKKG